MFTIKIELYQEVENTAEAGSNPPAQKLVETKMREATCVNHQNIQNYVRASTPEEAGATTFCGDVKVKPSFALRLDLDSMKSFIIEPPATVYVMNEQGKTVDKITV
ncbi:MAG: hypothetical protein KOO63_05630 [Bacteroidales bacterium]|nr:hypothetical protein [Candidatus Latescibacterota bacterium]